MVKPLLKPPRLKPGDTIAAVSLSWGGAGDDAIRGRYMAGKQRVEALLGLRVVEMPHTLAGSDYLYAHPEARAKDMMDAFRDPNIRGIFSCIGGDDTLRLLPYVDFGVIRNNPKVFLGYSDTTVNHFMCWKAGLASVYGPAILTDFAENVRMPDYTLQWLQRVLFSAEPPGVVPAADAWTSQYLEWAEANQNTARVFQPNTGYELVQGSGVARGPLIGGCLEVLDWLRGTALFPEIDDFNDAILFVETSEDTPAPSSVLYMMRALATLGVLGRISGMLVGKPHNDLHRDAYHAAIRKVLQEEGRGSMPVLGNMSFGHCEPKCSLPMDAMAEINGEERTFRLLESGVR